MQSTGEANSHDNMNFFFLFLNIICISLPECGYVLEVQAFVSCPIWGLGTKQSGVKPILTAESSQQAQESGYIFFFKKNWIYLCEDLHPRMGGGQRMTSEGQLRPPAYDFYNYILENSVSLPRTFTDR